MNLYSQEGMYINTTVWSPPSVLALAAGNPWSLLGTSA